MNRTMSSIRTNHVSQPAASRRVHRLIRVLIVAAGLLAGLAESPAPLPVPVPALAERTVDGFAVPRPGHRLEFPRDHGSHPEFKIEWWYVTGHLHDDAGRRFGFQATFFRRAAPWATHANAVAQPGSAFDVRQIHLAHAAVLDVAGGRFLHEERLNREGWDAASSTDSLDVRNGNWFLRASTNASESMVLQGSVRDEAEFALTLEPVKPLVRFGVDGVSRKAASGEAASYYLTFPRLKTVGRLKLEGRERSVEGEAWMDHEISSSQLEHDQAGWDWAGIQLRDGREIMAYRMRRKDGTADPFSTLAWVDRQGGVTHLKADQFRWSAERVWKSPVTGAAYPLPVRLSTWDPATGQPAEFTLEPLSEKQELRGVVGGVAYWEGACRVLDDRAREVGSAYVELTGYAGELGQRFR